MRLWFCCPSTHRPGAPSSPLCLLLPLIHLLLPRPTPTPYFLLRLLPSSQAPRTSPAAAKLLPLPPLPLFFPTFPPLRFLLPLHLPPSPFSGPLYLSFPPCTHTIPPPPLPPFTPVQLHQVAGTPHQPRHCPPSSPPHPTCTANKSASCPFLHHIFTPATLFPPLPPLPPPHTCTAVPGRRHHAPAPRLPL